MKLIKAITWEAYITLGLQKGYSNEKWSQNHVIEVLSDIQKELKITKDILLSAAVSDCIIVFMGQREPSLKISFIQYPKFTQDMKQLEEGVLIIASQLMRQLKQNRIVVVFPKNTIMLENDEKLDPIIEI